MPQQQVKPRRQTVIEEYPHPFAVHGEDVLRPPSERVGHSMDEFDEDISLVRFEQVQQYPQAQEAGGHIPDRVDDQRSPICAETGPVVSITVIGVVCGHGFVGVVHVFVFAGAE